MSGLYFKIVRILLSISTTKTDEDVVTKSSVIGEILAHPIYPRHTSAK
jgi:hypothetical protein